VGWDWFSVQLDHRTELMVTSSVVKMAGSTPIPVARWCIQMGRQNICARR
jgi:predicted secreted hydrolase